jgi:hypothetical protein
VKKKKAGNEISPENKAFVVSFYEENAKMCAGSREYVNKVDPNGAKIKKQCMLLLDKIEELFVVLVAENSTVKIGMIIDLILNFSCNFPSHFLYFIFFLYFFI